jgi:hypothetical protein
VPPSAALLLGGTGLLSALVLADSGRAKHVAVALAATAILAAGHRRLLRWDTLLVGTLLVILFIPIKKYQLPGSLPVDIEPYRLVVAAVILAWVTSLLIDQRVSYRATLFEGPLGLIVVATLGSALANPGRFSEFSGYVIKALTFFLSFVIVVYLIVSVVRTRAVVDLFLKVLVAGGSVLGLEAVYERTTGTNMFDRLESVMPMLSFQGAGVQMRDGAVRAMASSTHPIELSSIMVMLVPVAIYLALQTRRWHWWLACGALLLGNFATGSRTGFIGLMAIGAVLLWLRPRATLRLWPALLPAIVAAQVAVPGALGGIKDSLLNPGTVISEQQRVVKGNERLSNNRLADLGPSLAEYASYNPLLGQGYGTRITGFDSAAYGNAAILDNQWLKTLLETGLLGLLGFLWLFTRAIRRLGRRARSPASEDDWLPVALAAAIASYAVSMLTFDAFSFIQGTFVLYILLALAAVMLHLPEGERQAAEAMDGEAPTLKRRGRLAAV